MGCNHFIPLEYEHVIENQMESLLKIVMASAEIQPEKVYSFKTQLIGILKLCVAELYIRMW